MMRQLIGSCAAVWWLFLLCYGSIGAASAKDTPRYAAGDADRMIAESRHYISILKTGDFPRGMWPDAFVSVLYRSGRHVVAFFNNTTWKHPNGSFGHANFGIVVFENERYSHVYSIDAGGCYVVSGRLRCIDGDDDGDTFTDVAVADVLSGKTLLLDGQIEKPSYRDRASAR